MTTGSRSSNLTYILPYFAFSPKFLNAENFARKTFKKRFGKFQHFLTPHSFIFVFDAYTHNGIWTHDLKSHVVNTLGTPRPSQWITSLNSVCVTHCVIGFELKIVRMEGMEDDHCPKTVTNLNTQYVQRLYFFPSYVCVLKICLSRLFIYSFSSYNLVFPHLFVLTGPTIAFWLIIHFTEKSRIQTGIVGVEGEYRDHCNTSSVQHHLFFLYLVQNTF